MTAYVLDAGVFIRASEEHYGFAFCPAFWDWIDAGHAAGRLASTRQAGQRLRAGDDDLARWAAARPDLFRAADAAAVDGLRLVSKWAATAGYPAGVAGEFLRSPEYFLTGLAVAERAAVVTHKAAGRIGDRPGDRIGLPRACAGLGLRCVTPFEMLRAEGARFALSQSVGTMSWTT